MTVYELRCLLDEIPEDFDDKEVQIILLQRYGNITYHLSDKNWQQCDVIDSKIGRIAEEDQKRARQLTTGPQVERLRLLDNDEASVGLYLALGSQVGYSGYGPWTDQTE